MRTCDVSEPVSLFHYDMCLSAMRKVGMPAPPTKKMILMWDVLEEYVDEYYKRTNNGKQVRL